MPYKNTFIQVAADCPVANSVVPVTNRKKKPAHLIQYDLLSQNPYQYTHEDLVYEVYIRHESIPDKEIEARGAEIRAELLQKGHPCLRASALTKKYGWGAHYNQEGKIALYGMESEEYRRFVESEDGVKLLTAFRNKRSG